MTVVGTRPQLIKSGHMGDVFNKFGVDNFVVNTGQHYDLNMNDYFYNNRPNVNLYIKNDNVKNFLSNCKNKLIDVCRDINPSFIVVYGDTISTLAGALCSYSCSIPLIHIEAGLRSGDSYMPEEINRIFVDQISFKNYCPTINACNNLMHEKLPYKYVGDLMVEIFNKNTSSINIKRGNFVLATIHRQENTDNAMRFIKVFKLLNELADGISVIMPLHPRTRRILESSSLEVDNIEFIEPVNLLDMYSMLLNCKYVITDSGGLQREAYLAKKFCYVIRTSNEWKELIDSPYQKLFDLDKDDFNLDCNFNWKNNLLGLGNTSSLIVNDIMEELK
jgi:UDP-GlcNAc3NAcA epimerase